jgi:hypothetical protein
LVRGVRREGEEEIGKRVGWMRGGDRWGESIEQ